MYKVGKEYSRRNDIHAVYGGQWQGGISTPSDHPYIFIFAGQSGEEFGYEDGWQSDKIYIYTGEGQIGDMSFTKGNAAIRDHSRHQKQIYLFKALGKGKPVVFEGKLLCQSWDRPTTNDRDGNARKSIRFHLILDEEEDLNTEDMSTLPNPSEDIITLREKALEASAPGETSTWRNIRTIYRQRSEAVKNYVLARANGKCELTGREAPFNRRDGRPYLEVHHTKRLSDRGPDHPRWVAGICPSVHREIHFGQHGTELNNQLIDLLEKMES